MPLAEEQCDEFRTTGLLRLKGAFSEAEAESMRDRLWEFLAGRHALDRDDRSTWTLDNPNGFQSVTHSDAFRAVGSEPLCATLDSLFGPGQWTRPRWWGRPLLTFPGDGPWKLPARGWHFDFMPTATEQRPVQYFAFLNAVRPGGGGTLALAGSHRLVAPYLSSGEAFRMGRVRTALATHPWLRELWEPGGGDNGGSDRIQRYMNDGTVLDGVPLRVVELTGDPGDVILMHCDTFHAAAPNRLAEPRMMLTGMIEPVRREPTGRQLLPDVRV